MSSRVCVTTSRWYDLSSKSISGWSIVWQARVLHRMTFHSESTSVFLHSVLPVTPLGAWSCRFHKMSPSLPTLSWQTIGREVYCFHFSSRSAVAPLGTHLYCAKVVIKNFPAIIPTRWSNSFGMLALKRSFRTIGINMRPSKYMEQRWAPITRMVTLLVTNQQSILIQDVGLHGALIPPRTWHSGSSILNRMIREAIAAVHWHWLPIDLGPQHASHLRPEQVDNPESLHVPVSWSCTRCVGITGGSRDGSRPLIMSAETSQNHEVLSLDAR